MGSYEAGNSHDDSFYVNGAGLGDFAAKKISQLFSLEAIGKMQGLAPK